MAQISSVVYQTFGQTIDVIVDLQNDVIAGIAITIYHIGTECPLSGPKFSSAETGMGVTSRP